MGRRSKFDKRDSEVSLNNPGSESSRRRSILPLWSNLRSSSHNKDRSKSKERHEKKTKDDQRQISNESDSSIFAEGDSASCKLARVILPDKVSQFL